MFNCYPKKCVAGIILLMLMLAKTGYSAIQDTTKVTSSIDSTMVTGHIVDQDNRPLNRAKVSIKGSADTAFTDELGDFNISAVSGNVLIFTYPNHNVVEKRVKTHTDKLQVRLIDTYLKSPEEVDVIYGTTKKEAFLGSIATVYTNQLTTNPSSLYVYALPGQLAGLYTQQSAGFTTAGNTNPLTVFLQGDPVVASGHDIVPNDNTEFTLTSRGQNVTTIIDGVQRQITSIDPESIESISILKDGLSTLALGVNSSKPVLLVTTKKPEIGPARISFTAQTAVQQSLGVPNDPLPAYQWAYLYNEALQNDGKPAFYSSEDIEKYRTQSNPYTHPDVNWFKTILKEYSPLTSYKLNVSGGLDVARYTVSVSYLNQGGIFKTTDAVPYETNNSLSRYVLNSGVSVNVTKNLSVNLTLYGRVQQVAEPSTGYSNILRQVYTTPNNAYPLFNPDGSFGGSTLGGGLNNNLLSQAQYSGYTLTKVSNVLANLEINYNFDSFVKGLSFKGITNSAIESQTYIDRSLTNPAFSYVLGENGTENYVSSQSPAAQRNSFTTVLASRYSFVQAGLAYNRLFGKHQVSGQIFYDSRSLTVTYDLSAVTQNRAFKAAYSYDGKYFAEAMVNYSGYNRFPPEHENSWFYGGGLGWQMGKESFIKDNLSWLSSWKWRVTYGRNGNPNIAYYKYLQTFEGGGGYPQGTNYGNGNGQREVSPLANSNLRAEKADKWNFGADIAFFDDKLQLNADYYYNTLFDLVGTRGASLSIIGAAFPEENIIRRRYSGYELNLSYQNHINNFNYFVSGNGSVNYSKLLYFDEQPARNDWNARTGQPATAIFGYRAEGLYTQEDIDNGAAAISGYTPKAGDIKYADLDKNGVIDQYDETAIAGLKPLVFYGLSAGFNYKGLSFSVILQGVFNRDINFNNYYSSPFQGLGGLATPPSGQAYANALSRWTPETAGTALDKRLSQDQTILGRNNIANSTYYMKNGNYFRVKNAEIGYSLPTRWLRGLNLSSVRVFANGVNLFTISGFEGYDGMDPEVFNLGAYPIQRVFNAGITVKL